MPTSPFEDLLPAFQLLDGLLERSMQLAQTLQQGTESSTDQVSIEPVSQGTHLGIGIELAIPPAYPRYCPAQSVMFPSSQVPEKSRLGTLKTHFGLLDFDIDVLLIALAIELDRRYEKIYAYLQADTRCTRPSVSLVLDLLSPDVLKKLELRSRFASHAPLSQLNLVKLVAPSHQAHPSLLAHEIVLEPSIVRYLFNEWGLDHDLCASCSLMAIDSETASILAPPSAAWTTKLNELMAQTTAIASLCLYIQSLDTVAAEHVAQTIAKQMQCSLLMVDLEKLARDPEHFLRRLQRLIREGWLQRAVLCCHSVEALRTEASAHLYPLLIEQVAEADDQPIVLAGKQPWQPAEKTSLGIVEWVLAAPSVADRALCWEQQVEAHGVSVELETLKALAERFRLTSTQITSAVATAQRCLTYQLEPTTATMALFAAARNQSGHQLAKLAEAIHPRYGWDDLVLPEGQKTQLKEICLHMEHRYQVFGTWGFERKLSLGKGINALFAGPPGTGKTMAAEVIARELQLDLYKIDLSQVVSKFIGETEKNLSQIFTAAASANAILLFDEADALFGKRTEVKDSHDRYANLEVSYLLQQMEAYEGLAILTTNLKANLDGAFIRRLRFIIDFPLPSVAERHRLWRKVWPQEMPLSDQIDWEMLATEFELTGGSIRNIALAAAFLAADAGGAVRFVHIKQSIRREYQKMGKLLMGNVLG